MELDRIDNRTELLTKMRAHVQNMHFSTNFRQVTPAATRPGEQQLVVLCQRGFDWQGRQCTPVQRLPRECTQMHAVGDKGGYLQVHHQRLSSVVTIRRHGSHETRSHVLVRRVCGRVFCTASVMTYMLLQQRPAHSIPHLKHSFYRGSWRLLKHSTLYTTALYEYTMMGGAYPGKVRAAYTSAQ